MVRSVTRDMGFANVHDCVLSLQYVVNLMNMAKMSWCFVNVIDCDMFEKSSLYERVVWERGSSL